MEKLKQYLHRWHEDYNLRTFLGAGGSFFVTLVFAVYNAYLGIHLHSVWNGSISVYYILLTVIRGAVIHAEDRIYRKMQAEEKHIRRRTFFFSSISLIIMNLALIVPVTLMVRLQRPVSLGLIPVIMMAAHTVFKVTMASINFRKKDRSENLFVRELRSINLMDALLSIITLQNALISYKGSGKNVFIVSAITSAVFLLQMIWISVRNLLKGKDNL